MSKPDEVVKVGGGLDFPEGPAYDGKGNVAVSNCHLDYVTQFDAAGNARVLFRASPDGFQKTNGMTYFRDGSLFACDFQRNAIIRIEPDGRASVYADQCDGQPFRGPNDLAFDPHGNLYFTDPQGSNLEKRIGCVYRVDANTKKVTRVAEGVAYPNGLAFTADARTLCIAQSYTSSILRFPVREGGTLGPHDTFADLGEHMPDGIAFDSDGNLYAAQFGGGAVRVFDRNGKPLRDIRLPGKNPSNVEFAGKDLRTLYITEDETNALYKCRVEVPGLPLFCAPPNVAAE